MTNHPLRHFICAAALSTTFGMAAAQAATNTFDSGAQGWLAGGDSEGSVTWVSSGGNPGGHVEIDDAVLGGTTYFIAPAKFLGDQSAAFGTTFQFDLRQSYTGAANQFGAPDLILVGGGLTLAFNSVAHEENNTWITYTPTLFPTARWHLDDLAGAMPSDAQMRAVLSNLTALKIRAEFQNGPDTGSLDNVLLVPEPAAPLLTLLGAALALNRRRCRVARQPSPGSAAHSGQTGSMRIVSIQ